MNAKWWFIHIVKLVGNICRGWALWVVSEKVRPFERTILIVFPRLVEITVQYIMLMISEVTKQILNSYIL